MSFSSSPHQFKNSKIAYFTIGGRCNHPFIIKWKKGVCEIQFSYHVRNQTGMLQWPNLPCGCVLCQI